MITFYLLLLIPIFFGLFVKLVLHKTISWLEMFSMIVITSILMAVVYWTGMYSETRDTLVINGQVTSKEMKQVNCRHSYDCHCYTTCSGSGKNRSCTRHCSTCYDHSFDQDWLVHTTIGSWDISTVDRQGLKEPARWTRVKLHEPVSKTESYVNYVKAVPESLFNFNDDLLENNKEGKPIYPLQIYDLYKIDRFIGQGVAVIDDAQWKDDIAYMLGDIGVAKQVNVVVVATKQTSANYAKALQTSWIGGKKNDVVVVIGTPEYPKIAWVSVFSWSKNEMLNVQLRDDIREIGVMDRFKIVPAIRSNVVKSFVRKPMAEFEYLKDQIEPPAWVIVLTIILSLLSLGGMTYWFNRFDLWKTIRE